MSANILVVEYEPRSVEHVRAALADADFRLEIAASMDDAVNRCAHFEPTVVIITSILPNLKVEDAITQLRARAGLRTTPFLVLMSGYRGEDPRRDAARYGAQDILQRPFGRDDLRARVEELVSSAPNPAATQAIPREMLDALRRSADREGDGGAVTSDELFGDIVFDIEGGEGTPPSAAIDDVLPGAAAAAPPRTTPQAGPSSVDKTLADILESTKGAPAARHDRDVSADVDKMLSETLSGLDVRGRKAPAPKPPDAVAGTPAPGQQKAAPPAAAARGPEASGPLPEEPPSADSPTPSAPPPAADPSAPPAKAPSKAPEAPAVPPPPGIPPAAKAPPAAAPPPHEPASDVSAARATTSPGSRFGQYVIEERIAAGGMAEVYKARMLGMEGFQKTVAIKRILSNLTDSDEFVRMFIDEAKLAAQLNHNNIIHIYDLGKVDRSHYIAMEFIEGRDLRSILKMLQARGLKMPIPLALHIAGLLASALDYAHKKRDFEDRELGLVHRDVSPQNVLISFEGDVKLCDFGIAKAASKASQTRAGALKGKLQYMSPEQAWGKSIDHRSDIFSLGLVLYEMLTSKKVFAGDSELSVLEQARDPIIAAPSSYNPEVGPEIDRIVFQALHADRNDRYQSAFELQRDLEQVMRSKGWTADREAIAAFLAELEERPLPSGPPQVAGEEAAGAGPPHEPQPRSAPASGPAPRGPAIAPSKPPKVAGTGLQADRAQGGRRDARPQPPVATDLDDSGVAADPGGGSRRTWFMLAALGVLLAAAGAWYFLGGGSTPRSPADEPLVVPMATETPAPEPAGGLLSEEELIEQARAVAAAEIEKQEEALRQRLEDEFPTPTPYPPTPTPSPTATATATATATPTRVPPTATRVPPTATPVPPSPTPAVREGDIVPRGPDVIPPVAIQQEKPEYPRVAQRMRRTGVVEAEILVGIDGRVEEFRLVSVDQPGVGFEKATEDAVRNWRYKPATKRGVKVRMWVAVRVPFIAE